MRALGERAGRRGAKAANAEGVTPRAVAAKNGHADVERHLAQLESRKSLAKNLAKGLGCVPRAPKNEEEAIII